MSSLDVSSATQLHGDYMDVEQEVMSPAALDHAYHATYPAPLPDNSGYRTPHQTTDTLEGGNAIQESSESETEEVKPDLPELSTVQFEDISPTKNTIQQANDLSSAVSGYIQNIPVSEVPYNVTHEDIAKALSVNEEKVAVRIMRKVIPCLRITAYMKEAEFSGKKKIKGLWTNAPDDWSKDVPYKDPNNGEKIDGKLVPKANSEELRQMFKFLKNKVMLNIHGHISQLNAKELKELKDKGNDLNGKSKMGQYYFNTPQQHHPPCKVEAATSDMYQAPSYTPGQQQSEQLGQNYDSEYRQLQQMQQQQQHQVKQEPVIPFVPAAPDSQTSIPTFVANDEFGSSSPEQHANSSPDTSIDPSAGHNLVIDESMNDSDAIQDSENSEDSFQGSTLYYYVDQATGAQYFVQPSQDDTSSIESNDSTNEVQAIEIEPTRVEPIAVFQQIPPVPVKSEVKMPVKRQASVEPQISQNPGKRVRDETISRGPIQQVSSIGSPVENEIPKAMVEVAPQKRATPLLHQVEHVPSPKPGGPEVMLNSSVMHPGTPLGFSTHSPMAIYPSVPAVSHFPQQMDFNRLRLLEEMHQRLRDKIMKLTGMVLGDVEISVCLNKLYNDVVRLQFEKSAIGHQNEFVSASHACEALLDRAMLDGKDYQKEAFIRECNSIIETYSAGKEEHTQKTTVLTVTAPEPPPIQAEQYAKLQRKSIDCNPFSPSSGLSDQLSNLEIAGKKVDLSDPSLLGIKPRTSEEDMLALLNGIVEPFKQQCPPSADDDNLLQLPEKLTSLGVDLNETKLDKVVIDDMLKQLEELANSIEPAKPNTHVENAVDVIDSNGEKEFQKEVGQKIGPATDSSCYSVGPISNDMLPVSQDMDKDDLDLNDVLGLEEDYTVLEIMWKTQAKTKASFESSADKTPMQPSTPDDGDICIATAFGGDRTSGKQKSFCSHNGSHKKKPYQRPIQPKPQMSTLPSYNLNTDTSEMNQVHSPVNQTSGAEIGMYPATQLAPAQVTPIQQPMASVYMSQNNFGGGQNQFYSTPAPAMSCIPEVVENFDVSPASPTYEESRRRQRGRKRIINDE